MQVLGLANAAGEHVPYTYAIQCILCVEAFDTAQLAMVFWLSKVAARCTKSDHTLKGSSANSVQLALAPLEAFELHLGET